MKSKLISLVLFALMLICFGSIYIGGFALIESKTWTAPLVCLGTFLLSALIIGAFAYREYKNNVNRKLEQIYMGDDS